jgi:DNA repair exonuclease SbcCD ATPase subunit
VEAVEVHEADELRVATAEQALAKELDAHTEAWQKSIATARDRSDAEAVKRLEALREVETQRTGLRSAAAWLRRLPEVGFDVATARAPKPVADMTTFPDPRSAGEVLRASAVLDVLGDYLSASSLAGEREQIAQREAESEEEERRLAELREFRRAQPPLTS